VSPVLALVADIGGTNARFALASAQQPVPLIPESIRQLAVHDFPSVVDAARHYLDSMQAMQGRPATGVFAVAGRVDGDQASITNHPWLISRTAAERSLGLESLRLVNDFAAQAMAVSLLGDADLAVVGSVGRREPAAACRTYAVLGPGTGLGVSALIVRHGITFALETEGGHTAFAPSTAEEAAVLEQLLAEFGRVSNERLISGGGLSNIHLALAREAGDAKAERRPPQSITAAARAGDALCQRAVEMFCSVFGAFAGDLVLTLGAWDGVFLTGGLVPKLLGELQGSAFRRRFEAKGRFSGAMAGVPTLAVLHPQAGLLGAAAFALQPAQ
jgi:glucokinase